VAPDYVLIPRSAQDAFVDAIKEAAVQFRLDGALASDTYGSIVSDGHFKRLQNIMTKSSAKIVIGGDTDDARRRIAPTVYRDVKENDSLLQGYVSPYPFSIYSLTRSKLASFLAPFSPSFL
jgi:aldehyde dehydrogenase (NAD+)